LLVRFISNLKEENNKLKEKVRELSAQIAVDIKKEQIKNINFYHAALPGINKKQFIEKINSIHDKNFVACFINEDESRMIAIRTDCLDANELLKKLLAQVPGKGGGNKLLAQGSIESSSEEVFEKLRKLL
ncbi:MAG: hypothetical protein KJ574_03105, partial [Nanoarchaeota archaeon]|nr:hypothetical protein [Nanoarchaeota archaeon]